MNPTSVFMESFNQAKEIAKNNNHPFVDIPHLWLAYLLNVKTVRNRYEAVNQNPEFLEKYVSGQLEAMDTEKDQAVLFDTQVSTVLYDVLEQADKLSDLLGDGKLGIDMTLIALMDINNPVTTYLRKKNITKAEIIYEIEKTRGGKTRTQNNKRIRGARRVSDPSNEEDRERGSKTITQEFEESGVGLEDYGVDLVEEYRQGEQSPIIGRHKEINDMIRILSRQTKNNPILIGEPGVGKTAIVEGLAQRIVEKDVPDLLQNKSIFSLDMGALIAGASFRGEFEQRLKMVLNQVKESKGEMILFIDEIHTVVGAGDSGGGMDAGNLLKPMLARGEVRTIGSTTSDEYRRYFEKDKALARRFQRIHVEETSRQETITILRGLKDSIEKYHQVEIEDDALIAAVDLSERYITDRYLPDKAIDLIDEAAALQKIERAYVPQEVEKTKREVDRLTFEVKSLQLDRSKDSNSELVYLEKELKDWKTEYEELSNNWDVEQELMVELSDLNQALLESSEDLKEARADYEAEAIIDLEENIIPGLLEEKEKTLSKLEHLEKENLRLMENKVTFDEITNIVARQTGIPVNKMMQDEREKLMGLSRNLKDEVIGQAETVEILSDSILRAYANVQDPNKPIGSFLFLGPTGVGKTELAKKLAFNLFDSEDKMVRIDMSEYMEKHSVSRLVGAPPGYVGFEEGGQLTEAIRHDPYNIVLLDEIEKAHEDVFNILLQVLDDGRLTDSSGRTVDFTNTVVIMTSNIGSQYLLEEITDSGEILETTREKVLGELNATFRPEFLNRIDETLLFSPLSLEVIAGIMDIQLEELASRLEKQDLRLQISNEAKEWVAEASYDPSFGARPLKRFITTHIETPIAKMIIGEDIAEAQGIQINFKENKLTFDLIS